MTQRDETTRIGMIEDLTARGLARHAPVIALTDPLGEFLGALPEGDVFRYTYEDVVKMAGHSCPTVAGTFIATQAALGALYRDAIPVRGQIEVTVGGHPGEGVCGPVAQVIALITGAAPQTGFLGLMGRWCRKDLLRFDPELAEDLLRFRRSDTGRTVEVRWEPGQIPGSPDLGRHLALALSGKANSGEARRMRELWQSRVADILTGDPARFITVRAL